MDKILLLNSHQIEQKIKRMAYEIWEHNHSEKEVILLGVAPTGYLLAKELGDQLRVVSPLKVRIHQLKVHKEEPLRDLDLCIEGDINNLSVLLVDDVTNSGKTLLYALRPVLKQLPSKVEIAVLVNRSHKNFPIVPDIIGQSVATTLQEHIEVISENDKLVKAFLS